MTFESLNLIEQKTILRRLRKVKELRSNEGLDQTELGVKVGYNNSNISRIENGKYDPPLEKAQSIAHALNVQLHEALPDVYLKHFGMREEWKEIEVKETDSRKVYTVMI